MISISNSKHTSDQSISSLLLMYVKRTHFTICEQYAMRQRVQSIYERYKIHETLKHKHYNTKCSKRNTGSRKSKVEI